MVNSSENFGESKLSVEVTNSFSYAVLICFPPFLPFKMSKLNVTEYFKTRWRLQCEALKTIFSADTIPLKPVELYQQILALKLRKCQS